MNWGRHKAEVHFDSVVVHLQFVLSMIFHKELFSKQRPSVFPLLLQPSTRRQFRFHTEVKDSFTNVLKTQSSLKSRTI